MFLIHSPCRNGVNYILRCVCKVVFVQIIKASSVPPDLKG